MELSTVQTIVAEWAASQPLVKKAWLFGSRVRETARIDSDIDVAVEIERLSQADTEWGTFVFVSDELQRSLELVVPFEVDLEFYGGPLETPTIHAGLQRSSLLVYDRNRSAPTGLPALTPTCES